MDQKSLKLDKKGLDMDCRYKRAICSIFYILHYILTPARAVFLPKCNKIKQKVPDQKGVIFNGETLPSSIQIDLCLCLFNHSRPSSISSAIVRAVSLIFNFSIFSSRHSLLMVAADLPRLHYVNLPALYKQSTIYSIYTIHIMSTCLLCIYRVQTSKRSVGLPCP